MGDFTREIHIEAEPELVFRHLIEGDLMIGWGGKAAELDPRPGGIYRVEMGGDFVLRGEFIEVEPPHRLVYSWGWEGSPLVPPGSTRVEILLTAEGEGTRLTLIHTNLPEGESEKADEGWKHYLNRLRLLNEEGHAGPDAMAAS